MGIKISRVNIKRITVYYQVKPEIMKGLKDGISD
jgi:hypothetical protein